MEGINVTLSLTEDELRAVEELHANAEIFKVKIGPLEFEARLGTEMKVSVHGSKFRDRYLTDFSFYRILN